VIFVNLVVNEGHEARLRFELPKSLSDP